MIIPPEAEAPLDEIPEESITQEDLNCLRPPCSGTKNPVIDIDEEEEEE